MSKETKVPAESRPSLIDWQEIRSRIERGSAALEQRTARTGEETRKILKARAKALAGEPKDGRQEQETFEVVEFLLAYERYAIELQSIREVVALKEFTPVPGTPAFVVGIINVRGQIVSVIDLKKLFDLPAKGLPDLNRVIIIGNGEMEFGVLADAVSGVRRISVSGLQEALPTLSGVRAEYLKGVTMDRIAVLDAARLLADPKINVSQSNDA